LAELRLAPYDEPSAVKNAHVEHAGLAFVVKV
jgi:hypothetical protein